MTVSKTDRSAELLLFEGASPAGYWRRFSLLLGISVVMATLGLYRDSSAVVIAAMLIAPLMTPILGIAAALVAGWNRRAIMMLGSVILAAFFAIALAWGIMALADAPRGMRVSAEVLARTDPGIEELMVAILSGTAGAYVQINKQEISLLPGAAIGVSLVPPLSAAGILVYFGDLDNGSEAFLLFLTNLGGIVLAACVVYLAMGVRPVRPGSDQTVSGRKVTPGFVVTVVFLGLITLELARTSYERFVEARAEERVVSAIMEWAGDEPIEIIRVDVQQRHDAPPVAEVWIVIDVPLDSADEFRTPLDLIPPPLRENELRPHLLVALGPDYSIAFRYQTRFSGLVKLASGVVSEAPPADEILED